MSYVIEVPELFALKSERLAPNTICSKAIFCDRGWHRGRRAVGAGGSVESPTAAMPPIASP
jgi:hypothetical protein